MSAHICPGSMLPVTPLRILVALPLEPMEYSRLRKMRLTPAVTGMRLEERRRKSSIYTHQKDRRIDRQTVVEDDGGQQSNVEGEDSCHGTLLLLFRVA
jgi:hypothetical protein